MRVVSGFVIREIAGETIAIPTGDAAKELSGLVGLNGCGKFLFELLNTEQTTESLTNALLENFDVDYTTARNDVEEFLDILRKGNILIED